MSQDPTADHWLFRLSALQWTKAAQTEWHRAQSLMGKRRAFVTHLRRCAGMGLNGVLVHAHKHQICAPDGVGLLDAEQHWGRSYMDHLRAVARDPYPLRETLATPATRLLGLELSEPQPALVALRTGPSPRLVHALHDAQELLEGCIEYTENALHH